MGHKQNFKQDTKLPFLVLVVNWAEEIQKVSGYGKMDIHLSWDPQVVQPHMAVVLPHTKMLSHY